MSSPHERDGRFYGFNQDPYGRDPYRDPYTGYSAEPKADIPTRAYEVGPADLDRDPHQPDRIAVTPRRHPLDLGVNTSMFIGGVVTSAVIVALAAYLLCDVALAAIYHRISPAYWTAHAIVPAPPDPQAAPTTVVAVLAVLAAAAMFVLLLNATPAPYTFFRLLGALAVIVIALWSGLVDLVVGSAPWQTSLGPVVIRLILGWLIVGLVATTGRLIASTRPRRP